MPISVQDIINILETIAPENLAESWDNVGLAIGNPTNQVTAILLGLDPEPELLRKAAACGANLVITHHPIIFHPLHSIHTNQPEGQFITDCLAKNISIISCHTNLDSAADGVNDILAHGLGLQSTTPIVPANSTTEPNRYGLGRIGDYLRPIHSDDFIQKLKDLCHPPWLLCAGRRPREISRVAVCGGSCSELASTARKKGADVFVTAEVKHSAARWAEHAGLWIIDAGHFATEQPAMPALAEKLKTILKQNGETISVLTADQSSPLQLI
jgi:dinuclear metal center YbgI/SA1388 family protein